VFSIKSIALSIILFFKHGMLILISLSKEKRYVGSQFYLSALKVSQSLSLMNSTSVIIL
jgi:hypothetical protein